MIVSLSNWFISYFLIKERLNEFELGSGLDGFSFSFVLYLFPFFEKGSAREWCNVKRKFKISLWKKVNSFCFVSSVTFREEDPNVQYMQMQIQMQMQMWMRIQMSYLIFTYVAVRDAIVLMSCELAVSNAAMCRSCSARRRSLAFISCRSISCSCRISCSIVMSLRKSRKFCYFIFN